MTSADRRADELAGQPLDENDARLMAAVGALFADVDPVPEQLNEQVAFAVASTRLHAEVVQLHAEADLVGVRSEPGELRTVTFTSSRLTLMVSVEAVLADRARLDGWITPPDDYEVEIRTPAERLVAVADEDGRFAVDDLPRGLVRILFVRPRTQPAPEVVTPAITI